MRKLIAMLMALMMLFGIGAACAEDGAELGEQAPVLGGQIVGGWAAAEVTEITSDELVVFDKVFEGWTGVGYTPVMLLGTQVVAGTNYAFLCKGTTVTETPVTSWYIVYIYEDLQGNAKLLDIVNLELAVPSLTNAAE